MGRHAAYPVAGESRVLQPVGPVTDPRLFDQPIPPARPVSDVRPMSAPSVPHRFDDVVVADPPPSTLAFEPVSMRSAVRHDQAPVLPQIAGASLLAMPDRNLRSVVHTDRRYARTEAVPAAVEPVPGRTPAAFTRMRDVALAAAALAVVGVMSGAAALLPSNGEDAVAASKVDPVTSPVPVASASASNGLFCFSTQQVKQAMRLHHQRVASSVPVAPARTIAPTARPSASTTPPASTTTAEATTTSRPARTTQPTKRTILPSRTTAPVKTTTPAPRSPLVGRGVLPATPSGLAGGVFRVKDFSTQSSGAVISGGRLTGAGVERTVVEMATRSSTKAGVVPGNGNNQGGLANPVNPLYLLRGVSHLENVTVQGTEQGHLYNGLYMTGANLVIRHVEVNDIPGDSNANPGETFAIGVNRASGTNTVDDLTINGGSGALASSAGLAINNSAADWNINGLTTRNLRYSAGIALWQVRGTLNIRDYVQSGGARALGAERLAGTVNLYDPKWSAGTTGHDVTYTWDGGFSGGSINFHYSSAAQVPDRKIQIITNKAAGIAGSVHVFIGGVQQTASKYVTVN